MRWKEAFLRYRINYKQTFLCTPAVVARNQYLVIDLLESFYNEQFAINDSEKTYKY